MFRPRGGARRSPWNQRAANKRAHTIQKKRSWDSSQSAAAGWTWRSFRCCVLAATGTSVPRYYKDKAKDGDTRQTLLVWIQLSCHISIFYMSSFLPLLWAAFFRSHLRWVSRSWQRNIGPLQHRRDVIGGREMTSPAIHVLSATPGEVPQMYLF